MSFDSVLIANRGEIAIRIARAAFELGLRTVAMHSEDDAASLHIRAADEARLLDGIGAAAYLNEEAVVQAAKDAGCGAIHPGYGFLAERASFAQRCDDAGIVFVGPKIEHLELFGDKGRARAAAVAVGVPVLNGLDHAVSLGEARNFLNSLDGGAMIVKAVAGGGGRGTRVVDNADDLEATYRRCQSEARASFGVEDVYVEEYLARARHVEVQILGDHGGNVAHLGERECSVQRRYQKVVEIAPAPCLDDDLRNAIIDSAVRFAENERYASLGTFEFLVDASDTERPFVFIETNARLQVEHTVTEEVTGVDIVQSQIGLAQGASLSDLGPRRSATAKPRGFAIQTRVNMETFGEDGTVRPASGTLTAYEPPTGPGVRTDGFGYAGYRTSTAFDSLLAKVIAHSSARDFSAPSPGQRGRCPSFVSRVWAPTFHSCAMCWPTTTSRPDAYIRVGWTNTWPSLPCHRRTARNGLWRQRRRRSKRTATPAPGSTPAIRLRCSITTPGSRRNRVPRRPSCRKNRQSRDPKVRRV